MWDSLGEIAQSLLDIAFSLFGFNIDLGNMGLTAKEFCDWNTITASEFGTLAEILNSAFVSLGLNLLTVFVMIDLIKKAMEIDRISWERIIMVRQFGAANYYECGTIFDIQDANYLFL